MKYIFLPPPFFQLLFVYDRLILQAGFLIPLPWSPEYQDYKCATMPMAAPVLSASGWNTTGKYFTLCLIYTSKPGHFQAGAARKGKG